VVAEGGERDRMYAILAADAPSLRAHEGKTTRQFPVVVLEGVPAPPATA
jgi:hypothetical protein